MLKELIEGLGDDSWVLRHLNQEQSDALLRHIDDVKKIIGTAKYTFTAIGVPMTSDTEHLFIASFQQQLNLRITQDIANGVIPQP